MTIRAFKVGGIRFFRIGRLQFSFCVCRKPLKARPVRNPDYEGMVSDIMARFPNTLEYLGRGPCR